MTVTGCLLRVFRVFLYQGQVVLALHPQIKKKNQSKYNVCKTKNSMKKLSKMLWWHMRRFLLMEFMHSFCLHGTAGIKVASS